MKKETLLFLSCVILIFIYGCSQNYQMKQGQTITYEISGFNYEVNLFSLTSTEAIFSVNGEKTINLEIGDTHKFSHGLILNLQNIYQEELNPYATFSLER